MSPLHQDLHEFGQLVAAHPLEAAPLGLEVHLDEDAEEIETGRDGGGLGDLDVGGVGELGHQEGRGAHDGGHDLAARGGGGFDRAGEFRPVAELLHHRDGEASRSDGVGDGAPGDGPLQGARDHGHLGRSAGGPAGDGVGDVDEELADPRLFQKRPEEDEQKDERGGHPQRNAEDPLRRESTCARRSAGWSNRGARGNRGNRPRNRSRAGRRSPR